MHCKNTVLDVTVPGLTGQVIIGNSVARKGEYRIVGRDKGL
jgi:hypothetical protein